MFKAQALTLAAALLAGTVAAVPVAAQDKKELVFVVNGASDFWKLAEAGVKKAQAELPNYDLQFKYPEQAAAAVQQRLMDDLVAAGVDAIMVSAVDPKTSTEALNRVGSQVPLFTTDSDAPDSNRIAYIGSSNTDAGKQAGELMLKAMPDGGKCMGFVGLPGADNARERIEGVREAIKGSKVELVDVRGDDIDQTRAKRNVEDTLAANADINCMVGFYSYNPPRIYEALRDAGKLGQMFGIGGGMPMPTPEQIEQMQKQFGVQPGAPGSSVPVAPPPGLFGGGKPGVPGLPGLGGAKLPGLGGLPGLGNPFGKKK